MHLNWIKSLVLIFFVGCLHNSPLAQDIHFSQFYNSPLNLNPANTGVFKGDWRFNANHKRQWKSFANAYRTFSGSADKTFGLTENLSTGTGIILNNDLAGDGNFGTNQIYGLAALNYDTDKYTLSLGISAGYCQHSFDFNEFYFGNQYTGDQFDPDIPINEIPSDDHFSYLDISGGLLTRIKFEEKQYMDIGAAVFHPNKPRKSFYIDESLILPMRWHIHTSANLNITRDAVLIPVGLFMAQGTYREYNIGSLIKFKLNPLGIRSLWMGAILRAKDAGILCMGIDFNRVQMELSYDINISKLRNISYGQGGVEISMSYILSNPDLLNLPNIRKCPDFI